MRQQIGSALLTSIIFGRLISGLPLLEAKDLSLACKSGKIAVEIDIDETRFPRIGTLIKTLDGTTLFVILPDDIQADGKSETISVEPLEFSPNGKRIALRVQQNGYRIYIVDEEDSQLLWVTSQHRSIAWSPDSRRLAVATAVGDDTMISVFDNDSLRTVHTWVHHESAPLVIPMIWARDGSWLLASYYLGKRSQLVKLSPPYDEHEIIVSADLPVGSMAWNPSGTTMAFKAGSELYLYDGLVAHMTYTAPWFINEISWSGDGKHLALIGGDGQLMIVRSDGGEPWSATDGMRNKWLIKNVAWLDGDRFAFVLVTKTPSKSTRLYTGDVDSRTIARVPSGDIACTKIFAICGNVLYFKVLNYGPWIEPEFRGKIDTGGQVRGVDLGLYSWDPEGFQNIRVSQEVFKTGEDEHDFAAYYFPVIWVPPK